MNNFISRFNGMPLDIRYFDKWFKHLQPGFYVMEKTQFSPKKIIYVLPKKFKRRYFKSVKWQNKESKKINNHINKLFKSGQNE